MTRRPSVDYPLLAMETKLENLKLDPIEKKERWAAYELTKGYIDKYIADHTNEIIFHFQATKLVGSMADDTSIGLPQFDLLLPLTLERTAFTEPKCGKMLAQLTSDGKKHLKDDTASYFDSDDYLNSEMVGKYTLDLVEKAVNYFKTMTGTFPKHKPTCFRKSTSSLEVELQDKMTGDITLLVRITPVLHLKNDGILTAANPSNDASEPNIWIQNFSVKETDMVISWDRVESEEHTCQKDCVRLFKAVLISCFPKLPTYLAKMLVLSEVVATHNCQSHWCHDELSSRFVDMANRLLAGLQSKEIISFHSKYAGGPMNLLNGIKEDVMEKCAKQLAEDCRGSANALINKISIKTSRKPSS